MDSEMEDRFWKNLDNIVMFVITIVLILPLSIWLGFIVSWLWFWFAVPLGAPVIGAAHMAGLFLILNLAKGVKNTGEDASEALGRTLAVSVVVWPLALLVGFILHSWAF